MMKVQLKLRHCPQPLATMYQPPPELCCSMALTKSSRLKKAYVHRKSSFRQLLCQ